MNEKQIECFLTVSKYQSFSRAAQALFMTQPTVTHQIAALEEELGFSLFVRSYRAISLTPAGQRFEERMRPAVEQLQSIVSECKQIARNEDGCLTLGHYFPEGDWMFYHAIYAFSSLYPAFHIDTHLPPSTELVDRLLTRQLDAIVAPHQLITVQDELKQTTLFSNPEYCVMSRNHPLAERESLTLNDLQDTLCLLDNDDPFKIKTWHETQIRAQRSQFSSRNGRTMREIVTNLTRCSSSRTIWCAFRLRTGRRCRPTSFGARTTPRPRSRIWWTICPGITPKASAEFQCRRRAAWRAVFCLSGAPDARRKSVKKRIRR